ncbi:carboxymuconolactone decarboxylase family protein [Paramicrobacterium agarici]|uniref:AhpD family alkylhydroperoxidase n=1 Tax=Paramicrobacterium agarici TaxID=630514 RepID=A0A2A9DY84_9MICO|nr:carboxymuconolactone decarboxylase family protein [Microbacterium agarici]PFG30900.1 AhpD family alkylhydroperoxidase [Microbacterium agarici]
MAPSSRIHPSRTHRDAYTALRNLSTTVAGIAKDVDLDPILVELVQMRASQINGCAYCLDVHSRSLEKLGESAQRLAVLAAWREADLFSPRECAALRLTEAVTLIHADQLPDDVYREATELFSAEQYAALLWVIVSINSFNRVAIAGRYEIGPR